MSDEKIKYYKNPARKNETPVVRQSYVPQYKEMKMVPEEVKSSTLPGNVLIARGGSSDDNDNPRNRRASIRLPYAETGEANSPIGNSPIPNVGNSMEQTWSYIDGEMIDDLSGEVVGVLDNSDETQMIDNNDIVSIPGEPSVNTFVEAKPQDEQVKTFMTENDLLREVLVEDSNFAALKDDSYILIVSGSVVAVSDAKTIQDAASSLIFGEHTLCDGHAIPIEEIVVLKKVKIKVGLFLE